MRCLDVDDAMTGTVNGEEMPLSTIEFNILFKLLSYPNKTFSRAQLMDEFWGMDSDASLRSVDVYITRAIENRNQIITEQYDKSE